MCNSSSGPKLLLDCSLRDDKPCICRRPNPDVEDSSVPKRPMQLQNPKPQAPDTAVTSMASESQRVYDENLPQFLTAGPLHLGGHPRSEGSQCHHGERSHKGVQGLTSKQLRGFQTVRVK